MLYELLTGHPPFEHDDPFVVITKHLMSEPLPPRDLAPAIPEALEAVILQGLAKDPAQRPPSMDALARALRGSAVAGARRSPSSLRRRRPCAATSSAHRSARDGSAARSTSARTRRSARRWPSVCCGVRTWPTGTPPATASSARRGPCRSPIRT